MDERLRWTDHRIFDSAGGQLLFAVEEASLFSLTHEAHQVLHKWRDSRFIDLDKVPLPDLQVLEGLRNAQILQPVSRNKVMATQPQPKPGMVPLSTLVLEVAQDCNLRCTYCYADAGTYGATPCLLTPSAARRAVRYLIDNSGDRDHVTLILFGGEPLMNMPAVRAAVDEAKAHGKKSGKTVHLSITTNGMLLDSEIVDFLHTNRISVAVSLDGPRHIQDRNRPDEKGRGTYDEVVSRLQPLLAESPVPVAARVTLVPDQWHSVVEVFDHLIALGFDEVGIAPVSPVTRAMLPSAAEEAALLKGFGLLAERFVEVARKGRVMPLSNILDLLGRLHLGQTKTVSCGAGLGYVAVDARGRFFPCHRLVGGADFCVGDLEGGINNGQTDSCLRTLNNGREQSCSKCWARTLCAGGCHYENHLRENLLDLPRGTSCKFIRSWLDLGIKTYATLRTDDAIEAIGRRLESRAQC